MASLMPNSKGATPSAALPRLSRLLLVAGTFIFALLTPAQMMKIASGNTLLCRFRMDEDDMVWGLLLNHGKSAANDATARLHASILLAGRHQEAA